MLCLLASKYPNDDYNYLVLRQNDAVMQYVIHEYSAAYKGFHTGRYYRGLHEAVAKYEELRAANNCKSLSIREVNKLFNAD